MMLFTTLMMTVALAGSTGQQPAAPDHAMPAATRRPATLLPGIHGVTFPISTRREEAQQFFNQGLALVYAFNHEEAIRSFRRASEIDPASPMPWWDIALALGPNPSRRPSRRPNRQGLFHVARLHG